jgi:hypothetical protein
LNFFCYDRIYLPDVQLRLPGKCAMTETPQTSKSSAAAHRKTNWRRVAKVFMLLAVCTAVAAAICWYAMPREDAVAAVDGAVAKDLSDIRNIVTLGHPSPTRPWRFIIIHHSATVSGTLKSITDGHLARDFDGIGYHFLINNGRSPGTLNGQVTATDRWIHQRTGAHTKVMNHDEFNTEGIGICLVGNFELEPPTPEQMTALTMLVLALREQCNIPIDRIAGHGDLKETLCPGRLFPMERFLLDLHKASVKGLLAPARSGMACRPLLAGDAYAVILSEAKDLSVE